MPMSRLNKISSLLFLGSLLIFAVGQSAWGAPKTFYVSPKGNDNWSGGLPLPTKKDGPFATIGRVQKAIQQLKQSNRVPQDGIVVEFMGGEYYLANKVLINSDFSGKPDAPVIFRASPKQKVTFTGAVPIENAKPVTDTALLALIPKKARKHVLVANLHDLGIEKISDWKSDPPLLFFNGRAMSVTRWPAKDFVKIAEVIKNQPVNVRGTKGDKIGRFVYQEDQQSRWQNEPDAWLHGYWFWDWSEGRQPIASIDPKQKIIELKPPHHGYGYRKGQWYYAFNLLSELDQPGEWILDHQKGNLYFWPPGSPKSGQVTLSTTGGLFDVQGASDLQFQNLNFERTRGAAIRINNSEHVKVDKCNFRQIGQVCVSVSGGQSNSVENCHLSELFNSGITLSGGDRKTLTPANHQAINNEIHDYGRWKRMYCNAIAVYGVGQKVAYNLIYDSPHIGIMFGGNDHLMELNEIHHVCQESNDAGAIYSGRDWTMRGTIIRHNYLHHLHGHENRGCSGIYLDDMYSGTLVHGNVMYDIYRAFLIGGGRDVIVENNLIIDCKIGVHVDARALGWAKGSVATTMKTRLDAMPIQSELWKSRYPKLPGLWNDEPGAPKGTVVKNNVGVVCKPDAIRNDAKPYVTNKNNIQINVPQAGFYDSRHNDFRLKKSSVIYKSLPEFKPIPFEKIGLQK